MAIENNTFLAIETDPDTGEKWGFTSGGGWEKLPLPQYERTTVKPSMLERFGKGVDDVVSGVKQGLLYFGDQGEYDNFVKEKDREEAYYNKALNESNHQGMDWARIGGQAGMLSPLGLAPQGTTTLRQGISGMMQGGTAGGAIYTPSNQSKAVQVVGGMLGGGAGNIVAQKMINGAANLTASISNAFNNLRSRIMPDEQITVRLTQAGVNLDAMPENYRKVFIDQAKEQIKNSGKLDVEALARKAQAEDLGFSGDYAMTTSQATRNPTLWGRERDLAKTEDGTPIMQRYQNQNERLTTQLRDELPRSPITGDDLGDSIYDSVNAKWNDMQTHVGNIYKQIDREMKGFTVEGLDGFRAALDEMADDATATPIIQSVINRGNRIGLFGEEQRAVSVTNIENFRKFINNLSDKNEPALKRLKKSIIDQLDDAVIDATGQDAYAAARDTARNRFIEFETKLVKSIVDGKATPDDLFRKVISAPKKELDALKYSLTTAPVHGEKALGADTWAGIQSEALDWLWSQATATMGKEGQFSGTAFKKALDKIGGNRLKILFDDDMVQHLYKIRDTSLNLTRGPVFDTTNHSGTAARTYDILSQIPAVGNMLRNAAKQNDIHVDVNRAMSGAPAVQLTPEEVLTNMKGLLNVSPVLRPFVNGTGLLTRQLPALTSSNALTGLLEKPLSQ